MSAEVESGQDLPPDRSTLQTGFMTQRISIAGLDQYSIRTRHAALTCSLLLAACSAAVGHDAGVDPPCMPDAPVCTPEEAATLSASEMALIGSTISLVWVTSETCQFARGRTV